MATVQAKRIKDALQKVRRVGRIEEAVTIAGCEVTLQNLSPDEFEAALSAIEGLEDVAYAHAYQMEQVSRAILEVNGQDLREADYIEDEVPAGHYVLELVFPNKVAADTVAGKLREQKLNVTVTEVTDGAPKTVKVERHQWLQENLLKTWSREALTVAWRKFTEVLIKADAEAKKGVNFLVPDETAEEKYRRLLSELRETEDELPDELIHQVLGEAGLLKKSRQEELDAVNERLAQVQKPVPEVPAPAAPVVGERVPGGPPPVDVQQAMAARTPLNNQSGPVPVPAPPAGSTPVSASPRAKVPDQVRRAAMQNTQGIQSRHAESGGIQTRRPNRAAEIAALEGQVDPTIADETAAVMSPSAPVPVTELSHRGEGIDERGFRSILDQPPAVGVNPKFHPRS